MHLRLSQRAQKLTSSAIRELLKITERPEVISFAGGLPSPDAFPVEAIRAASERVFAQSARAALQYGPTEGYGPLREWIAARHGVSVDEVLITTGSQQALDLIGKVMIDPGSPVLVETPTYLGALQAFSMFGPRYVPLTADDAGLRPESIYPSLAADARFLYVLPNYQNPTGRTMTLERRKELIERADTFGLPLIEDNPYGDLCYHGEAPPSLHSLNREGVVYLGSFSKVLAPGLRLGYVLAPAELIAKLAQAKQAADLHTPSFTQYVAYEALRDGLLERHLPSIRALYAAQCEAMLDALAAEMPPGVRWNRPAGGMFIWVELPAQLNSMHLLETAIERNVAFVPGASFYAGSPAHNTLRLAFVTVPPAQIRSGIATLGGLIREALAGRQAA